jgi:hypothetical protein
MSKRSFTFISALFAFITIQAQTIKEIPLTSTTHIELNAPVNVIIYKSDTPKLIIKGTQMDPEALDVKTGENGVTIGMGKGKLGENTFIEIYTNNIQHIFTLGSGDIEMKDEFSMEDFNLTVGGSGDFKGMIHCKNATITVSGSSDVKIAGSAENVNAVSSGSSDLKLLDFPTKTMKITVAGAGDAYVNVTDELTAVASGASDVFYQGKPAKVTANAAGSSDIRPYNGEHSNNNDQYNFNFNWNDGDSTKFKNHGRFFNRPRDMWGGGKYHQDFVWMGLDLGIDGLVDLSNGFDLQPQGDYNFMEMNYVRNTHVRINFFEWRFNLVKNVFNIVTGLGWDFQHYAFAQKVRLDEADDYPGQVYTTPIIGATDSIHSINRSRLAVQYFQIPLFLNLRTKKTAKHRQQFNFTFGVVGGIRTGASSRIIYTENGRDVEEEKKDDFNLETFTATAMVRIKYSFFSIYASYQFTPMFRGQNPNLYPFSLGVTLLSW